MADIGTRLDDLAKKYIVVFIEVGEVYVAVPSVHDLLITLSRYTSSTGITRSHGLKFIQPNHSFNSIRRCYGQHASNLDFRRQRRWQCAESCRDYFVVHVAHFQYCVRHQ